MTVKSSENEKLVKRFFSPKEGAVEEWICLYGVLREQGKGFGLSNVLDHIMCEYRGQLEKLKGNASTATSSQTIWSAKSLKLYAWLDMVNNGLEPFCFVERELIRKHVKYPLLPTETLMKYMHKRTLHVEQKRLHSLATKFSIV